MGSTSFFLLAEKKCCVDLTESVSVATINFTGLPTYADEAAATTGGLSTGDLYKTATGEIRIKL